MVRIKEIIDKNKGIAFVVHTKNQNEVKTLAKIFDDLKIPPAFCLEPVENTEQWMDKVCDEFGYNNCWRICERKGIAFNPDIKHWKEFGYDIIEIDSNNEIQII